MDGIINFHKPVGITSARALYRVRGVTGQRKSGHAGTLDPGASGVLVLCLGKATKLVERVMDQPKVYRAIARLDITSESFDMDRPVSPVDIAEVPDAGRVREVCAAFEGVIQQVPPQISAVKIEGRPAYRRAASEPHMKLKARPAHVYWLHLHRFEWPELEFEMCCGRGTYVRALVRDIGEKLATGGCLADLSRTRVGPLRPGGCVAVRDHQEPCRGGRLPDHARDGAADVGPRSACHSGSPARRVARITRRYGSDGGAAFRVAAASRRP